MKDKKHPTILIKSLRWLLAIPLLLGANILFSQDENIYPNYLDRVYPRIDRISTGPTIWYNDQVSEDELLDESGYYYRILIVPSEKWEYTFLERVGISDEEGFNCRITHGLFLSLSGAFPQSDLWLHQNIKSMTWVDSVTVQMEINDTTYQILTTDYLPLVDNGLSQDK